MKRFLMIPLVVVLAALALWLGVLRSAPEPGLYHGVVEAEQYEMAFELSGRIAVAEVDEGDAVEVGQVLAGLDEADFKAALEGASAREAAQKARLEALEEGTRPGEIATAEARVEQARANLDRLRNGPTAEELQQARARMQAARERWRLLENGPRPEDLETARAALRGARSDLDTASREYERYLKLYEGGAVAAEALDRYQNGYAKARSRHDSAREAVQKLERGFRGEERRAAHDEYQALEAAYRDLETGTRPELVEAARSELAAWQSQLDLALEGPRSQDVVAGRQLWEEARAATVAARLRLEKARLLSPVRGRVLRRNLEVGEMAAAGVPVFTLVDLERPWVEIFVPEGEIGQIRLEDRFEVTVDSLQGQTFPGRVTRVYERAEFTPKTIQTERERVNLVFRVKVSVDNPELELKPGMPADARRASP